MVESALGALPERAARAAGRGLASAARWPLGIRRRVVESQLAAAFPDRDRAWVRETSRACYRHFGEELALLSGGASRIATALGSVHDPDSARDVLARALPEGRGAVMVAGHLGNWELAGAYLAHIGFPVTAVIQPQRGPAGARVEAFHRRLGFDVAYRDDPARRLVRALREGRMLALVADQHARRGGVRLDFLGRPAWTTLGPARLCIAARVPLFFASLVREGDGYLAHVERIEADAGGEGPAIALTRAWTSALERAIRAHPEQYLWSHRRWKNGDEPRSEGNARARIDVQMPATEPEDAT